MSRRPGVSPRQTLLQPIRNRPATAVPGWLFFIAEKQKYPKLVTELGIVMEVKLVQPQKQ